MKKLTLALMAALAGGIIGCDNSSPNSSTQSTAIRSETHATLEQMEAQDPTLQNRIANAYGYAIFPDVGSAAVVIGGANGKGEVFRNNQMVGHATLSQASIGAQLGGDTYGELIVFQDEAALNRLMNNSLEFGADASATLIKAGAAGATEFANGVIVYVLPKGGLKAGVAVSGQKFHFDSLSGSASTY